MKYLLIVLLLVSVCQGQTYVIVDSVVSVSIESHVEGCKGVFTYDSVKTDTIAMLPVPVCGYYFVVRDYDLMATYKGNVWRVVSAPEGDPLDIGAVIQIAKRDRNEDREHPIFRRGIEVWPVKLWWVRGVYQKRDPDFVLKKWDGSVKYRFAKLE